MTWKTPGDASAGGKAAPPRLPGGRVFSGLVRKADSLRGLEILRQHRNAVALLHAGERAAANQDAGTRGVDGFRVMVGPVEPMQLADRIAGVDGSPSVTKPSNTVIGRQRVVAEIGNFDHAAFHAGQASCVRR